ncbi:nucleolar complex protein 4 homolog A isoform X1 [Schistocerca serialis cubense]|uniref:nucleolar complex protein 4 homolog A isoform X1 n=1 Tax=Schistocerca serialis cubense TaxID=2023355 RepID=UPI00214E7C37|nr:nucleolar complex protein 4 homolog A isoform X1 [Schistocerca serialis cubense]
MCSKELRNKVLFFLENRKYANNLIDILSLIDGSEKKSQAAILALELAFSEVLKRGDLHNVPQSITLNETDAEQIYKLWLRERYEEYFDKLLWTIEKGKLAAQLQALSSAVKLYIVLEGRYPLENTINSEYYFPLNRLKFIISKLLSNERANSQLITRLLEYTSCKDFLQFTWKVLPSIVVMESKPNEIFLNNLIELLDKIPIPRKEEEGKMTLLLYSSEEQNCFVPKTQLMQKWLNKVWNCMSKWEYWNYSPVTQRHLLVVLLEKLLPHLEKPLLLTDYFIDSMDVGGPVSLLALQGIFTLIQHHNLEYPNIYKKLYSLFEPEIFHTKYKARLFYLSDIFLSSTHLPENLVAAFVKRLSRLALLAPPQDILIILRFVGNLLIRHPGLQILVNCMQGQQVTGDPFIMEESDPVKSHAIESSLWEIQALQTHHIPSIASAARFINFPLPSLEWDLSDVLEVSADDLQVVLASVMQLEAVASGLLCGGWTWGCKMFERELKKKVTDVILTFEKPTSLSLPSGERLSDYWSLV